LALAPLALATATRAASEATDAPPARELTQGGSGPQPRLAASASEKWTQLRVRRLYDSPSHSPLRRAMRVSTWEGVSVVVPGKGGSERKGREGVTRFRGKWGWGKGVRTVYPVLLHSITLPPLPSVTASRYSYIGFSPGVHG
jgi:hypothetical protein